MVRRRSSGGLGQVGLLPGVVGLIVCADSAEQGGEVAGGEFPVERVAFWLQRLVKASRVADSSSRIA